MAVALLRWSLLPFVHRGELHDLPYLDRSGRSWTAAITNSPSRASTMPKHDSRSYGRNTGCHRPDRPSSHGAAAHDEEIRSPGCQYGNCEPGSRNYTCNLFDIPVGLIQNSFSSEPPPSLPLPPHPGKPGHEWANNAGKKKKLK